DTSTVRSVFIVDPKNKVRLTLTYPKSIGRNFGEIMRVIDALQLTDAAPVSTPADWQPGDRIIVAPTMSTDDARQRFEDVEEVLQTANVEVVAEQHDLAATDPEDLDRGALEGTAGAGHGAARDDLGDEDLRVVGVVDRGGLKVVDPQWGGHRAVGEVPDGLLARQPRGHARPSERQLDHGIGREQINEPVYVMLQQQLSPLLQDLRGSRHSHRNPPFNAC